MLDEVVDGDHLLAELGVADYQPSAPPTTAPPVVTGPEPIEPSPRGCTVESPSPVGIGATLLLLGFVLIRRRE
jgi:MYXO-CTERM domain-containing protein